MNYTIVYRKMKTDGKIGAIIRFKGIVQGVGFRPFVYREARKFHINGTVRNSVQGVVIEAEGRKMDVEGFYEAIRLNPPRLAEIHDSSILFRQPFGHLQFTIVISSENEKGFTPISPDIATCDECLAEVFDPSDRRYRYPFTNCTNCGPRFTIIERIPYDRKNSTMRLFPMCSDCNREYNDPLNRRYHAQPNACPVCGPQMKYVDRDGAVVDGDPIKNTITLLNNGGIVAIKGIGGFHLAVYPLKREAVTRLRENKGRPAKPFALMARDIVTVQKYCSVNKEEKELLESKERPIVLVQRKPQGCTLPLVVAPDTEYLGMMLPYTPLHHLLLREGPEILIMTSANYSEEPLIYDDTAAFVELRTIVDAFLFHNRPIARPCDDSVMMVIDSQPIVIRRSRGIVPRAIFIGTHTPQIVSMGAFEKNSFCVIKEGKAFVSHHIGDLSNEKSVNAFMEGIEDFIGMFRITPEAIACDMHPDYYSTIYGKKLAKKWGIPVIAVQHHHAHIASVLAEQQIKKKVLGISFDGTGYGTDGTVWGAEFLVADAKSFYRAGHFAQVPMPGGERSIIEIDRMALSYLYRSYGSFDTVPAFHFISKFTKEQLALYGKMIKNKINTPLTSSCGRLFDAVSALLGLCSRPQYDAQGAILLESAAGIMDSLVKPYTYEISKNHTVHFEPLIRDIVDAVRNGVNNVEISRRFHSTIIDAAVRLSTVLREETGITTIVLSGGAFQNKILLLHLSRALRTNNFKVYINTKVPPNDGGISLGQGYVACNTLMEE